MSRKVYVTATYEFIIVLDEGETVEDALMNGVQTSGLYFEDANLTDFKVTDCK